LARRTDRQFAAMVRHLRAENEILRGQLPKRFTVAGHKLTGCCRTSFCLYGMGLGFVMTEA